MAALSADHMVAYELALRGCSRKEAASNWFCVNGAASHVGNNSAGLELICRGNSVLHLYFAAFGAVVAANIVAVIAIAATIKRDRYWPLWLWPNVPKVKSHLSRWL